MRAEKRCFTAHEQALWLISHRLRVSWSFTVYANQAISQLCIIRSRSAHYIPMSRRMSAPLSPQREGSKMTKITTGIHFGTQRRCKQKTETCYVNFLLFILKKFLTQHIQSKRRKRFTAETNKPPGCSSLSCIDFTSVSHFSEPNTTGCCAMWEKRLFKSL